jgi:hypothetical protein
VDRDVLDELISIPSGNTLPLGFTPSEFFLRLAVILVAGYRVHRATN